MPAADNDSIVVDLSNYKDKIGSRITPGKYRVLVEDAEKTAAKSGNPMINLWFRVLDGEFEGQTVVDRLVLTENSMFRVVGFMQALGMQTPKKRLAINLRQFIGKVMIIEVEDGDPYNGRVKSEVRGYVRANQPEQTDLDDVSSAESGDPVSGTSQDAPTDADTDADTTVDAGPVPQDIDLEKIDL